MRTLSLLLLIVVGASFGVQLQAQSLATVAKKEEDRRKGEKPSGKVYTNNDLKAVPTPPLTTSTDSASTPAAADAASLADGSTSGLNSSPAGPKEVRDRAYWSKRMQAALAQLETDKVLAEALQSRVNALNADFASRDDPAQRSKIANDREKALAELARLKAVIVVDGKAIPALEEEARRAGVPPGWLR